MNLRPVPRATTPERLDAVEKRIDGHDQARKTDGARLDKIETMVAEIHGILVKARGFKWVLDGFFKYAGYFATTGAAVYGAWRLFTGR